MPKRLESTTTGRRVMHASLLAATLALAATTLGAPTAGADPGWSRVPASGIAGGSVRVASSAATLCQWVQPAPPADTTPDAAPSDPAAPPRRIAPAAADGDTTYDGTEVRVRLARDGVDDPARHAAGRDRRRVGGLAHRPGARRRPAG